MELFHGRNVGNQSIIAEDEMTRETHRRIAALLVSIMSTTGFTSVMPQASSFVSAEKWSMPVEGVRGRLVLVNGVPANGTPQIQVFLELQNVSDVANAIHLLPGYTFKFEMTNSTGRSQPTYPASVSVEIPKDPIGLVLPYESTLRFLISVTGVGIAKDQAAQISVPQQSGVASWVIGRNNDSLFFLSAVFSATLQRSQGTGQISLKLPKVQIPR